MRQHCHRAVPSPVEGPSAQFTEPRGRLSTRSWEHARFMPLATRLPPRLSLCCQVFHENRGLQPPLAVSSQEEEERTCVSRTGLSFPSCACQNIPLDAPKSSEGDLESKGGGGSPGATCTCGEGQRREGRSFCPGTLLRALRQPLAPVPHTCRGTGLL